MQLEVNLIWLGIDSGLRVSLVVFDVVDSGLARVEGGDGPGLGLRRND